MTSPNSPPSPQKMSPMESSLYPLIEPLRKETLCMSGSFKLASPPASCEGAVPEGFSTCSWVMAPGCGFATEPGCCGWFCAHAAEPAVMVNIKIVASTRMALRTDASTRPKQVCIKKILQKTLRMWTWVKLHSMASSGNALPHQERWLRLGRVGTACLTPGPGVSRDLNSRPVQAKLRLIFIAFWRNQGQSIPLVEQSVKL